MRVGETGEVEDSPLPVALVVSVLQLIELLLVGCRGVPLVPITVRKLGNANQLLIDRLLQEVGRVRIVLLHKRHDLTHGLLVPVGEGAGDVRDVALFDGLDFLVFLHNSQVVIVVEAHFRVFVLSQL